MIASVVFISIIGVLISLYGIMVERKIKNDMNYKAACDISEKISCTKTFISPYANMLGISTIVACLIYYVIMFILGIMNCVTMIVMLSLSGLSVTVWFAYILFFKIRTVCLICISLYILNSALVIASLCTMY
jgi:vitamin-K-epoxide reductase (warfarin-sensitive)